MLIYIDIIIFNQNHSHNFIRRIKVMQDKQINNEIMTKSKYTIVYNTCQGSYSCESNTPPEPSPHNEITKSGDTFFIKLKGDDSNKHPIGGGASRPMWSRGEGGVNESLT
jgi:hypothetical protein